MQIPHDHGCRCAHLYAKILTDTEQGCTHSYILLNLRAKITIRDFTDRHTDKHTNTSLHEAQRC